MAPEHLTPIPPDRTAIAPYNFVPLPAKIVCAEESSRHLPARYDDERHTGQLTCILTTESPLYVRCGYTPEEYARLAQEPFSNLTPEEQQRRAQFFHRGNPEHPVIPGSSLRGMLRALVEIAGYGKLERVTDVPRFFFRAVAAPSDDPLAARYQAPFGRNGEHLRVGYLERDGQQWYVRPVQPINGVFFIKIKEYNKTTRKQLIPDLPDFKRLNDQGYRPQYIPCSFTTRPGAGGMQIDQIGPRGEVPGGQAGFLVTSGNMLETNNGDRGGVSPRTAHTVVPEATTATRLALDPQAVADYRASLTEFQRAEPFDPVWGALMVARPIFYCEPATGESVSFFGHSPNFRIPYRSPGQTRAATPRDFVPETLRCTEDVDLAEVMFGFVRNEKQNEGKQARAGRIFVGDATLEPGQSAVLDAVDTPQVLSSPKPTTFQHYLVQRAPGKVQLKHYASTPEHETAIRGHKLYWHKSNHPTWQMAETQRTNETQKTRIRPVKAGTRFCFTIHFENLSNVELGALLWVLQLTDDTRSGGKRYRLKLGMGKPLGLGAVKLDMTLQLTERVDRYRNLFSVAAGLEWDTGAKTAEVTAKIHDRCMTQFNTYVLTESCEPRPTSGMLKDTLRMQCLLAMLSWPGPQAPERHTRYMEIEREREPRLGDDKNEYADRRILPTPLDVL